MRILVTGGAGCVGSNLVERLLAKGYTVTVLDNLSAGSRTFLTDCEKNTRFGFICADLLNFEALQEAMAGVEVVFHLAANSDITQSRLETDLDLRLGTLATYNVLEAMRLAGVSQIIFASSSVVYGEPTVMPTSEDYGPLFPISFYGASKLAAEALISAYCHNFGFKAWIYRFANICGRHGTHGVIVDFIRKLQSNSSRLEVLGDGMQAKPYLHVGECVDGMLYGWQHATAQLNYFNLGCEGSTSVARLAQFLLEAADLKSTEIVYTGGQRGWTGDVPQVRLDCSKLERMGWKAKLPSDAAVKVAVAELVKELNWKSLPQSRSNNSTLRSSA
jgi:UDP-glucose 4-epimerase